MKPQTLKHSARMVLAHHLLDHFAKLRLHHGCRRSSAKYSLESEEMLNYMLERFAERMSAELVVCLAPAHLQKLTMKPAQGLSVQDIISILRKCCHLSALSLEDCEELDVGHLVTLTRPQLTSLVTLNMGGCQAVGDKQVHDLLRTCPHLHHLTVDNTGITDYAFHLHPTLQNHLELTGKNHHGDNNSSWQCRLSHVSLSGCQQFTNVGLLHLVSLSGPSLRSVSIQETQVNFYGLLYLSGHGKLSARHFLHRQLHAAATPASTPTDTNTSTNTCFNAASAAAASTPHQHTSSDFFQSKEGEEERACGASPVVISQTEDGNEREESENEDTIQPKSDKLENGKAGKDRALVLPILTNQSEDDSALKEGKDKNGNMLGWALGQKERTKGQVMVACRRECANCEALQEESSVAQLFVNKENLVGGSSVLQQNGSMHSTALQEQILSSVLQDGLESSHSQDTIVPQDARSLQSSMPKGKQEHIQSSTTQDDLQSSIPQENLLSSTPKYTVQPSVPLDKSAVDQSSLVRVVTGNDLPLHCASASSSPCFCVSPTCSDSEEQLPGTVADPKQVLLAVADFDHDPFTPTLTKVKPHVNNCVFVQDDSKASKHKEEGWKSPHEVEPSSKDQSSQNERSDDMEGQRSGHREKALNSSANSSSPFPSLFPTSSSSPARMFSSNLKAVTFSSNLEKVKGSGVQGPWSLVQTFRLFMCANPELERLSMQCTVKDSESDCPLFRQYCQTVFTQVLELIGEHLPSLHHLSITQEDDGASYLDNSTVSRLLTRCSQLYSLDVSGQGELTDAAFLPLQANPHLERLVVSPSPITFTTPFFTLPPRPAQLASLDLTWCEEIQEEQLNQSLRLCPHLTVLKLRLCKVTTATLEVIAAHCWLLRHLEVAGGRELEDEAVVKLARALRELVFLDLSLNCGLTNYSVQALLSFCPRLETLDLSCLPIITSLPFVPMVTGDGWNQWIDDQLTSSTPTLHPHPPLHHSHRNVRLLELPSCRSEWRRSSNYGGCLKHVDLSYCNSIHDDTLRTVVTVCRGGVKVINYYKETVTPFTDS